MISRVTHEILKDLAEFIRKSFKGIVLRQYSLKADGDINTLGVYYGDQFLGYISVGEKNSNTIIFSRGRSDFLTIATLANPNYREEVVKFIFNFLKMHTKDKIEIEI